MTNSFYYFFSATPQVLAAILALFGVFVIFKIQIIKAQLFGIGQSIIDEVETRRVNMKPSILNEKMKNISIITRIKKTIHRHDINELKDVISLIENQDFELYWREYNYVYYFHQSLIRSTINWSIFTAIIIIICLATIPFSDLILNHIYILYALFNVVIVCIIICFYRLILILKKSLNDTGFTSLPKIL